MKSFICIFMVFLPAAYCFAQDSAAVANDVTVLYRKELSGGATIHSNGLGVLFRVGRHVTAKKKRMFDFEFVSMRHPKQYKITNENVSGDPKPVFFGKLNFVFVPRAGIGMQKVLYAKGDRAGVEVRYSYFGGLNMAITKPVYNNIILSYSSTDLYGHIETRRYDPYDPDQQDITDFFSPGPFFRGFNEIKIYPGIYGKASVSFEYATVHQKLAIIETGMVADLFLKEVPIMAFNPNSRYFFNLYISLLWGGKKN